MECVYVGCVWCSVGYDVCVVCSVRCLCFLWGVCVCGMCMVFCSVSCVVCVVCVVCVWCIQWGFVVRMWCSVVCVWCVLWGLCDVCVCEAFFVQPEAFQQVQMLLVLPVVLELWILGELRLKHHRFYLWQERGRGRKLSLWICEDCRYLLGV